MDRVSSFDNDFEMLREFYSKHKNVIDFGADNNNLFKAIKRICTDEPKIEIKPNSVTAEYT